MDVGSLLAESSCAFIKPCWSTDDLILLGCDGSCRLCIRAGAVVRSFRRPSYNLSSPFSNSILSPKLHRFVSDAAPITIGH